MLSLCMQVLFIAPVHGKKNPQLSYPYDANDKDNSINNLETIKQNNEFLNRALDVTRGRLENIVKRPKRSGSKVCFCWRAQDFIMPLHRTLDIVWTLWHAGIGFVHWSKRVSVGTRMAPCRC